MEYRRLRNALQDERINFKDVAIVLDIDEKTFLNKLYGKSKSGFTWDEASKVHRAFLRKYDKDYLFLRDITDEPAKSTA